MRLFRRREEELEYLVESFRPGTFVVDGAIDDEQLEIFTGGPAALQQHAVEKECVADVAGAFGCADV